MRDFELSQQEVQDAIRNGQKEIHVKQQGPFKTIEQWTGQAWETIIVYEPRWTGREL